MTSSTYIPVDRAQCSGTTRKGTRCRRVVLFVPIGSDDPRRTVRFCHQHTDQDGNQ